jgi:hypothetical protein
MSHLRTRLGLLWVGDAAELTMVRNGKRAVTRATITDTQQRAGAEVNAAAPHGAPMMWTWAHGVPAHMM